MAVLVKGGQIYTENGIIENGYIKIKDQKIIDVGLAENLDGYEGYEVITLPSDHKVIPGLIDIHIHGADGADTMDATKDALTTIANALPREGTTSFLATTMTQEEDAIDKAIENVGDYMENRQSPGKAEILGIHLEGPFINPFRAGAQPVHSIVEPDLNTFASWQKLAKGKIKVVTLAPEQLGGLELVRYLTKHGIIASLGHSDATYEQVLQAIDAGASHVTHLFNQMRGIHHREPGVAGAALLRDELKAEIIVDGIHVLPEMVELAFKNKGKEGLLLITDSMRAKCLKDGQYDLGGQEVTVKDGKAVLHDGTLAGSTLRLGQAVKNIVIFTKCSLEEAIEMAAANPAKQLNLFDQKGSLKAGKDADLVILNETLDVVTTFCRGKRATF